MRNIHERSLEEQVVIRLRRSGHFLHYYMGGRNSGRRVLMHLSDHGEMPQKTMQELMHVQAGSLSEVIIKLEKEGLLTKARSKQDGRQWLLRLTPAGEALASRVKEAHMAEVAEMLGCFSEPELMQLNMLLEKMLLHWDAVAAAHEPEMAAKLAPWAKVEKEMRP